MLGPHAEGHRPSVLEARAIRYGEHRALGLHGDGPAAAADRARQHVHRGRADEFGDEAVGRRVVELERRADLLDMPALHHHDLVGHRHRLDLVVGHIDRRGREPLVQLADLGAHLHAQLGVEVRQRLVEQEHLRIAHDGAAHGHPLALSARERARIAVEIGREPEDLGGARHPCGDLGLVHPAHPERERHVRRHGLVRVERVVLEHHRDVALGGRQVVHHPRADGDGARRHLLEPGDHPQECRLAAARRADENDELPVEDVDVDPVQHLHRAIGLAQVADRDLSHARAVSPVCDKGYPRPPRLSIAQAF